MPNKIKQNDKPNPPTPPCPPQSKKQASKTTAILTHTHTAPTQPPIQHPKHSNSTPTTQKDYIYFLSPIKLPSYQPPSLPFLAHSLARRARTHSQQQHTTPKAARHWWSVGVLCLGFLTRGSCFLLLLLPIYGCLPLLLCVCGGWWVVGGARATTPIPRRSATVARQPGKPGAEVSERAGRVGTSHLPSFPYRREGCTHLRPQVSQDVCSSPAIISVILVDDRQEVSI